jgi:glycosyltransferase involved in cell wall biosynthesis
MKILHLNTSDIIGGAARAAYRIHTGLQSIEVDTLMLVQNKTSDDESVLGPHSKIEKIKSKITPYLNNIPLMIYKKREQTPWSPSMYSFSIIKKIEEINPDIINLHWVCGGFLPISVVNKFTKPIVWTLHDSWPFTGGCHVPFNCTKYQDNCGKCPQLNSNYDGDLSRKVFNKKSRIWKKSDIRIVTPSNWLAECARKSSLFSDNIIEVIPNGLNLNIYSPIPKIIARDILGLSVDKKIILFGAMSATSDPNKGYEQLKEALNIFTNKYIENSDKEVQLVVFGSSKTKNSTDLGIDVTYMGRVYDDISLALLYSAADVVCVPSIQEAFGQTASEALACGTPVVAFNSTGLIDIVDHKLNGYLANPYEPSDFADGIHWIIEDEERYKNMEGNARKKAEETFDYVKVARKYQDLYLDVLQKEN